MDKVFILTWAQNTRSSTRMGVFTSLEKAIAYMEKAIYYKPFTDTEKNQILEHFNDNYLYEKPSFILERAWLD
jgi:hypothetical protein